MSLTIMNEVYTKQITRYFQGFWVEIILAFDLKVLRQNCCQIIG